MRWLTSCLIFLFVSCQNKNQDVDTFIPTTQDSLLKQAMINRADAQVHNLKDTIRTGDLILRTGNDFTSESLRSLCQRDKTYSHCGIASVENDTVFVYHALGGEWNPDQKIRRDALEIFSEAYSNRGIGVYRFALDEKDIEELMVTVKQLHRIGVMFDMDFDLKTNDHMYCAEFVYKSYLVGTKGKLQFDKSHIGAFEFMGVDDLFLHPKCTKMAALVYK